VIELLSVRSQTLTRIERCLDVVLLAAAVAVIPVIPAILIEQSHAGTGWKTRAAVANLGDMDPSGGRVGAYARVLG